MRRLLYSIVILLGLSSADLGSAEACEVINEQMGTEQYYRLAEGNEIKVGRDGDRFVAKIRLGGALDTNEFAATYVERGELVELTGYRTVADGRFPVLKLYAFIDGTRQLRWLATQQRSAKGSTKILLGLGAQVECLAVPGSFVIPEERVKGLRLHKEEVEVSSNAAVLNKLFGPDPHE